MEGEVRRTEECGVRGSDGRTSRVAQVSTGSNFEKLQMISQIF